MSRKVLIITGANTAREINHVQHPKEMFGSLPVDKDSYYKQGEKWEKKDDSLKEYRITNNDCNACQGGGCPACSGTGYFPIEIGSKRECKVNENDLTCLMI